MRYLGLSDSGSDPDPDPDPDLKQGEVDVILRSVLLGLIANYSLPSATTNMNILRDKCTL
jgi:hypothetical protein